MMALISLAETLSSFVRFHADLILVGGAGRLLLPSLLRECRRNKDGKSNRAAPPTRIKSAQNLTNDDKVSAREIRAIIHAKTKSTPSS